MEWQWEVGEVSGEAGEVGGRRDMEVWEMWESVEVCGVWRRGAGCVQRAVDVKWWVGDVEGARGLPQQEIDKVSLSKLSVEEGLQKSLKLNSEKNAQNDSGIT